MFAITRLVGTPQPPHHPIFLTPVTPAPTRGTKLLYNFYDPVCQINIHAYILLSEKLPQICTVIGNICIGKVA